MKIKWYLSTLIIVLTLLGIKNNTISQPNQEIIVQFNASEVTARQSQEAIAVIIQQLSDIGINNIQIHKESNGKYKIAYYSFVTASQIKKSLLSNQNLAFDTASFGTTQQNGGLPSKENHKKIDLLVYDIQSYDKHFGLLGTTVVNQKNDLSNNTCFTVSDSYATSADDGFLKPICLASRNTTTVISNTLHTIPEVRAGPQNS